MNVLIVPDVHGRTFWRRAKELVNQYQKIIFLGDYLDPYSYEGITPDMALEEFKEIIEFKKKYPKKVTLLLGNHDLHYVSLDFIPSTRRNDFQGNVCHGIFKENKDLFTCFKMFRSFGHKWLFSHAGITKYWLRQNELSLTKVLNMSMNELLDNKGVKWGGLLEQVSYYRGGSNEWGSPVWMDIHEGFNDSMVIDEKTTQIVGHNQLEEGIYLGKGVCFTDCKKLIALNTKTREITYA